MTTRPLRRVVVVGTGTGVGKTWLSCALLRRLRALGHAPLGLKPIESGVSPGADTDARSLALAAGHAEDGTAVSATTAPPYRLADPISPHLAARRAGVTIELEAALRYVQQQESGMAPSGRPVAVIESAGGLFSPLAPGMTNFDLARALDPAAWLLVAPDALGVLHDVTATLTAARALGRVPDAVALCRARPADASTGTNADELARLAISRKPWVFPDDGEAGLDALLRSLLD
ncbi:MAG TPA: dethiobiotin synthase [Polyangiaceae bacterium]|nr:dethiobiotin synthase [Polyangiaceae bacterium]